MTGIYVNTPESDRDVCVFGDEERSYVLWGAGAASNAEDGSVKA